MVTPRKAREGPTAGHPLLRTRPELRANTIERKSVMGLKDKISNAAEDLGGKAKEAVGKGTDDRDLQAEGQVDQAKSSVKQAGENVKDAVKDITK
jgi:uncharacterized protein YjbJ (UPF0337 family)